MTAAKYRHRRGAADKRGVRHGIGAQRHQYLWPMLRIVAGKPWRRRDALCRVSESSISKKMSNISRACGVCEISSIEHKYMLDAAAWRYVA